jgi:Na+/serine symporter
MPVGKDKDSYTTRRNDVQFLPASTCLSRSALTAFPTISHSAWIHVARQLAHLINAHSHSDHTHQDLLP